MQVPPERSGMCPKCRIGHTGECPTIRCAECDCDNPPEGCNWLSLHDIEKTIGTDIAEAMRQEDS